MITTHEDHKAQMLSMRQEFSTWRTATLMLGMTYLFVNYGLKQGRSWIYQTSILWDSRDVLDFCQRFKNNKSAKIAGIYLLEPVKINRKETWRWATIREVRSYEKDHVEHPVYVTVAGEALGLFRNESKRKLKLICRAPRDNS